MIPSGAPHTRSEKHLSAAGRGRRGGGGAAEVLVVLDAVELDVDAANLPGRVLVLGAEDGDAAHVVLVDGGLGELGVPDEGDLIAVPGSDALDGHGDEIGGGRLVANESGLVGEDGESIGETGDGVDALGEVIESLVGDVVGIRGLPVAQDGGVVADERVDIGLAQALLGVALGNTGDGGRGAGGEDEEVDELHVEELLSSVGILSYLFMDKRVSEPV